MGKLVPTLALVMLTSAAQLSAQPRHEYWFTAEAGDHSMLEFVDAASVAQAKGGIKRAWAASYYAANSHTLPGGHDATLWEFNCRTRQARSIQVTSYNISGEAGASEAQPEAWSYVVPGSIGEADLGLVCASASERKALVWEKLSHTSVDAWVKRWFEGEANATAWAKLTPVQQLDQAEPDWRQLAASKAFADWLATAPESDQQAARRNGNQLVDASEAMGVIEHFRQSQQHPAAVAGAGQH